MPSFVTIYRYKDPEMQAAQGAQIKLKGLILSKIKTKAVVAAKLVDTKE